MAFFTYHQYNQS